MKNNLTDLNDHLFSVIDRLDDDELMSENPEKEIARAKAITNVAAQVVQNGKLMLDAQKFMDDRLDADGKLPRLLE